MRPRQTIRIYLRHHNNPRFASWTKTCADYTQRDGRGRLIAHQGCGATMLGYRTYPNEKPMYFDGPPEIVEQAPTRQDGAVIAIVYTDNVHFVTCPRRHQAAYDGRARAAGS